ncbi:hypothetical protein FA15DRAFT_682613 [Coprinopsis marcescibilis]|uniref:Mediator of RNA polymerase II transcription subunit 19 n=1 Tax=Coprinopsis marcescibilis TaxID=230819 RepID=A0A5C3KJE8_COPMA|nr:hypothetical protein FA15DRAFT_682613 [Coprinopsis marcescibilis]
MFIVAAPPKSKLHLQSSQDLLARLNLHPAYDRYVRPAVLPGDEVGVGATGTPSPGDKGKGKEVDVDMSDVGGGGRPPHGLGEGDDDDGPGGKKEKKGKNSYRHLIKGMPGKHSTKKDEYLTNIMLFPSKPWVQITPFDEHTQEDSFTVSQDGLKGWNINALVAESAQAREDRKKRKEAKRLSKLQQTQGQDGQATSGVPLRAPVPTPATAAMPGKVQGTGIPQRTTSTPRPATGNTGTPRPGSAASRPGSTVSRPGSTVSRPGSTVPRPGSTVPKPGSATAQVNAAAAQVSQTANTAGHQRSSVPRPGSNVPRPGTAGPNAAGTPSIPTSAATSGYERLKKRDRDDGGVDVGHLNGSHGPGLTNGGTNGTTNHLGATQPKAIVGARAGAPGARPRPLKKIRLDGPADSNQHIQQQPTPQGV